MNVYRHLVYALRYKEVSNTTYNIHKCTVDMLYETGKNRYDYRIIFDRVGTQI